MILYIVHRLDFVDRALGVRSLVVERRGYVKLAAWVAVYICRVECLVCRKRWRTASEASSVS